MAAITLAEICDAVADTLGAATGINRVQHHDELGEGLMDADLPLMQVYFDSFRMSPPGDTDRHSFGRGVSVKRFAIYVDVFACQRHNLWQDVEKVTEIASEVLERMEDVYPLRPYFGLEGIQAWALQSAQRAIILYGQAEYMAVRFTLEVVVF